MSVEWRPVVGYEGLYEVSNDGQVRSLDRPVKTNIRFNTSRMLKGRLLRLNLKHNGYYNVDLCKEGRVTSTPVHRIVAEAFIPNPECVKVVNHISGVKTDNRVENLEWVTYKENHWHARSQGLLTEIGQYQNKPVLCVETDVVFANSIKAAEWLISSGCSRIRVPNKLCIGNNIRRAVSGGTPKAYGYHWKDVC